MKPRAIWISAAVVAVIVLAYLTKKLMDRSKMIWPVRGAITSLFGKRTHPISGESDFHNGIDIAAPSGTFIKAPFDGKVKSLYTNSTGGKQLIIEHDNGYTTGYAHLSAHLVAVGDRVNKGQDVATVGSTGASTGPHLHFTMRDPSGTLIDPTPLLT